MKDSTESKQLLRVLLVEDNPLDAKVCLYRLNRAGYQVLADQIETRDDFIQRIETNDYDLVISDYGLLGWTGLSALELLQRTGKDIPFILLTGTLGEETAVKCIKMGASDYVLKDRLARLPVAVKQALEEKSLREAKRMAESALKSSNQRIVSILESIEDAFFSLDKDWRITYLNPNGENLLKKLQRSRRTLLGQVLWSEFPQGVTAVLEPHLPKAMEERVSVSFEGYFQNLKANFEIRAFPSEDGLSVYARDITMRKQLEEEQIQLIRELQEALGKVKTLSGLLPICASCKKIRDDQGYWNKIETYLRERSDIMFTHGLCPDCTTRMYPEFSKKSDSKS